MRLLQTLSAARCRGAGPAMRVDAKVTWRVCRMGLGQQGTRGLLVVLLEGERLIVVVNRIHAMAPITAPLFGLHILKGIFSLKNGTKIVLLIMRTSPFKGTCLFIRLK